MSVLVQLSSVKSDRKPQKVTIGVTTLPSKFRHYVVPSKETSAYLQVQYGRSTQRPDPRDPRVDDLERLDRIMTEQDRQRLGLHLHALH